MLSDPANLLARSLGCKQHTSAFYAVEVTASFVLSGVAHMFMMPFHDPTVHRRETFVFFLLRPGAIFCEVLMEGLMRRTRSLRLRQMLRWVWTLGWFYFTLPLSGQLFQTPAMEFLKIGPSRLIFKLFKAK
jgi:hypothetical protein